MSKKLCKGKRKDGSPCQGQWLDQYDGYCIAHGPPPDQTHQWRSLGGKNSATAARLDKRIPERLKDMLDVLDDGMKQVIDGSLSPARYAAICRGVKLKLDIYRQGDKDMDLIRTEEIQAAAAEYVNARADLDILGAADAIKAKQDQYRGESLVDQGFAEFKETSDSNKPPDIVLNDRGRDRFGYQSLPMTEQFLSEIEDELDEFDHEQSDLPEITGLLGDLQEYVGKTLSAVEREDVAPFDPLTGQAITKLPTTVQTSARLARRNREDRPALEVLKDQRSQIKNLKHMAEELSQDEDYKRKQAELEENRKHNEETAAFLKAHGHKIDDPPPQKGWQ